MKIKLRKNTVPVMEWNSLTKADLTIGESKQSKIARYMLMALCFILCCTLGVMYYFRADIYDFIVNPHLLLKSNEINLEVHSKFNPKDYLIKQDSDMQIILPKANSVNTEKLGTYKAVYKSKNRAHEYEETLTVHVKDTTPPEITLFNDLIILPRDEAVKEKFNPIGQVKSITDNYDTQQQVDLELSRDFDLSKDTAEVVYVVRDRAGNESVKKLQIYIKDKVKETTTTTKETTTQATTAPKPTQPVENNDSAPIDNTPAPTQATNPPTPAPTEPPVQQPFINGVHDITVHVGDDFSSMVNQLISGVYGSGYVSCDYGAVNMTTAGVYPVTFSSSDGVTQTATVTVVE